MKYFVVEYDRRSSEGTWSEFSDRAEALKTLRVKEAAREPEVEVVFFMADSLDALRVTHSRYFLSLEELTSRLSYDTSALPRVRSA